MWWLLACRTDPPDASARVEPIERPADQGAPATPVGVRTELVGDLVVEVWYPAAEAHRGEPGEAVDLADWFPASVTEVLGDVAVPPIPTSAVRDAALRNTGEPLPVVIFSHGFAGIRSQSVSLTTHWASRGFVVVATDHAGRSLPDLLPCLFSPPLEGCAVEMVIDPALDDVTALRGWLSDPPDWLAGAVDPDRVALTGHSAGGYTTVTLGETAEEPFTALIPMAGGDEVISGTPTLRLAGTCDGTVPAETSAAAHAASGPSDTFVEVNGGGHLVFSDLCAPDLGALAEEVLLPRDDLNAVFVESLLQLGTDGCAGYPAALEGCGPVLPPEDALGPLRAATAAFLEGAVAGALPADPTAGHPELVSVK